MQPSEQTRYTICPIEDASHLEKLSLFLNQRGQLDNKSSYCRFFLRGICIMKPQYCKFAHSFKQLNLTKERFKNPDYPPQYNEKQTKQERKRTLANKKQFNQTPLFILKHLKYHVLYEYQASERYQRSKRPIVSLDEIGEDHKVRIRIREVMHREEWDKVIDWLEDECPHGDLTISIISLVYAWVGFDKPATRCKFSDFIKYMMHVRKYIQIEIVLPPALKPQTFMINSTRKQTYLQRNIDAIWEIVGPKKQAEIKEKMDAIEGKALPQQLIKSFICRYFMAGNCQQPPSQCKYAHSIQQLNYNETQEFLHCYRQPVMPLQKRLNYVSLHEYAKTQSQFQQYDLQDINFHSQVRNKIREKMHHELFGNFLNFLSQKYQKRIFEMKELHKYYQQTGFNHTNENKFQHFQHSLWPLRYCCEEVVVKQNLQRKKKTIVFPIQSDEVLDEHYKQMLRECIEDELEKIREEDLILESSIRRSLYSHKKQNFLPFHQYLRLRQQTVQQLITSLLPVYSNRIFFQTSSQNHQKIMQLTKKFIKKKKYFLCSIDEIENHIKHQNKEHLNVNKLINVRSIIQQALLETGKFVFFWPFQNNAYAVDPSLLNSHVKNIEVLRKQQEEWVKLEPVNCCFQDRVVIVDSQPTLQIAKNTLIHSRQLGVDLEGRLNKKGYIDLIQVSTICPFHKQKNIFVFDMWRMKSTKQYQESSKLLKRLFEDQRIIKILHDCRQDSMALYFLLGIKLENVFDTSGMDIYIQTIKQYEKNKGTVGGHLLKKVYDVRVPGLNTILDKWEAPTGINVLKQSMKKIFAMEDNRPFLEQRPFDPEYLQYSIRDVQDLIEVYHNMKIHDTYHLQHFIGKLYSESYLHN